MPVNSDGVPFDCSHIYANGNMAANMYANVTAEATGRVPATRLYGMTDDPGMKDMLAFLIARDSRGEFSFIRFMEPLAAEPSLSSALTEAHPQVKEASGIRSTLKDMLER